jgi:hypothetical protein
VDVALHRGQHYRARVPVLHSSLYYATVYNRYLLVYVTCSLRIGKLSDVRTSERIFMITEVHGYVSVVLICSRRNISAAIVRKFPSPTPSLPLKVADGLLYFFLLANTREYFPWALHFAKELLKTASACTTFSFLTFIPLLLLVVKFPRFQQTPF